MADVVKVLKLDTRCRYCTGFATDVGPERGRSEENDNEVQMKYSGGSATQEAAPGFEAILTRQNKSYGCTG